MRSDPAPLVEVDKRVPELVAALPAVTSPVAHDLREKRMWRGAPWSAGFLCLTALGYAAQEPGAAQSWAGATELEAEVRRVAEEGSLWPGFEPLAVPLAVFDGEQTLLFRHPSPPPGFVPLPDLQPPVYIFAGRHPVMVANTSEELGGVWTATVLVDSMPDDRSLTDLAALAVHEVFHVFAGERHPAWSANEASLFVYPVDEPGLLALRRLETEALRRALDSSGAEGGACWARVALEFRRARYAELDAEFVLYERGIELSEGLATYVELRAAGRETVELPPAGFEATTVRQRGYKSGPALALLLDRFGPGWTESFEEDDGQTLDGALALALESVEVGAPDTCAFSDREVATIEEAARLDAEAVQEARRTRRAEFEDAPGWRIVIEAALPNALWPQGFDPLNVERVDGGILHGRMLRLGNESGELEMLATGLDPVRALTEGAGPHPLFNGVVRVSILVPDEPQVETLVEEGSEILVLRAGGLRARFARALLTRGRSEILVRLQAGG